MASPQKEDGHIDIANEIVDKLCSYRLSGQEWQVLWVVLRKTWGWNKKHDRIALSQFEVLTGIDRRKCHRLLKKLVDKKVLKRITQKGDRSEITYGIQKDFEKWKLSPNRGITQKGDRLSPNRGMELSPKRTPTNTTITKDTKERIYKKENFRPPTKEDIEDFCLNGNLKINIDIFLDHYKGNGWMIGKTKMKDWKATVRNWARRDKDNPKTKGDWMQEHNIRTAKEFLMGGGEMKKRGVL